MCGGGKTTSESKDIDKALAAERKRLSLEYKLLLLGAGESGKSTIVKQMQIIHHVDNPFSDKEVLDYVPSIHHNVLSSMAAVLDYMEKKSESGTEGCEAFKVSEDHLPAAAAIQEANESDTVVLTPELAGHVKTLWQEDAGVKKALEHAHEYQFPERAVYFYKHVDRLAATDYRPSTEDILSARRRTTGIKEFIFESNGVTYRMIDVGGQRSERKKWFNCFEDVTAILFIVALSEYNLVMFEDDQVNRMHDSLALFGEIANSKWFVNTSIILFLNKKDLFEEKIKEFDLSECFPNYKGGGDFKEALEYIKRQFLKKVKDKAKTIYTHATCAMDTGNIKVVFDAVKDTIQKEVMTLM